MTEKYVILSFEELSEEIRAPLKQTQRIKYTCFDTSHSFYVFGATSGSLYLFQRDPCSFLQLIPSNYGSISRISISRSEKHIAFSTTRGFIGILIVNIENSTPQIVTTTQISNNDELIVTCFLWGGDDDKHLFYGDKQGNVTRISLTNFLSRSLVHITAHPILLLEHPIVDISGFDRLLLVSTITKCVLCNTDKEEFKQIGNRPRDGEYGACFIAPTIDCDLYSLKIYCARPGSRLWEVDIEGNVLQTHQLKQAIASVKPTSILKDAVPSSTNNDNNLPPKFTKVFQFNEKLILVYTENTIYIFDTKRLKIVFYNNQFDGIQSIKLVNTDCLTIYMLNGSLIVFKLVLIDDLVMTAFNEHNYLECAELIKNNLDYFQGKLTENRNLSCLIKLKEILMKLNFNEILDEIRGFFTSIDRLIGDCDQIIETNSIFVVNQMNNRQKELISIENGENERNDQIIVVNSRSSSRRPKSKTIIKINGGVSGGGNDVANGVITGDEDEKILWDLYMVYKSSQISNLNFTERYSRIFDRFELSVVIGLIKKLRDLIVTNGQATENIATRSCYELFLNYFNCEMMYEIDEVTRDFVVDAFTYLNRDSMLLSHHVCVECRFPLIVDQTCEYPHIGYTLMQYFWSRKEYDRCYVLIENVSYLLKDLLKFYIQDKNMEQLIPYSIKVGDLNLFLKSVELFDDDMWNQTFQFMDKLHTNSNLIYCLRCREFNYGNLAQDVNVLVNKKVGWFDFLNIAINYLTTGQILQLLSKYSSSIRNEEIGKEFYLKCLLKA